MATVEFQRVEKRFGTTKVIHGVSFDIRDGEFMVLVGPSGCGKSTLLRMLAGLEEISGGSIAIDGRTVNDIDSKDRDIAMVFQSYALYPHMNVRDNMGFSLRLRKAPKRELDERVAKAARILNLEPYLDRYPRELSGGQRKRVALAQVLALEPQLLLMDEPFSALDAITRARLSQDLLRLVEERHMSVLLVTHDLEEALALSDMVYLLSRGPKARIAGQYPVPIPRPRDIIKARTHPEFGPLLERIWQNLSREVVGEPGKDDQWAGFSIGL